MKTRRNFEGFTLIELLTVIAIIGILAAIIIPVTGRVRASARQAAGLSVLKGIGIAMHLHAAENKELLPGPFDDMQYVSMHWHNGKATNNQLTYRMAQYIGSAKYLDKQLVPQICPPGFDKQVADITLTPAYMATNHVDDGSGTRIKPFGDPSKSPDSEDSKPKKITRIVDPARKVALMDMDNELLRQSGKAGNVQSNYLDRPLYGARRNVLYFDAHVRSVPATASYDWLLNDFP